MSGHQIPASSREVLLDEFNRAPAGLQTDKVSDSRSHECRVVSYDPFTHTARVRVLQAGYGRGDLLRVRVRVDNQGVIPGTGGATALFPGQHIKVEFVGGSMYGLFNQPEATGSVYVELDQPAPAYAPWHQDGTGTVVVYPAENGGIGNAEHVSATSKRSVTRMGDSDIEDWGNEHVVVNGVNATVAETQMRDAAKVMKQAAARLGM